MGLCSSTVGMGDGVKVMGTIEEVRQWRENVVTYRQRFKQTLQRSQSLVTRRDDVYCECLEEPWKAGKGSYDVGDLFHSTFQKSTVEINMAFKGGKFNQLKHGVHIEMDYSSSIVLVLKSKKSHSVYCACLLAVHSTTSGEVIEMIWFATRERYQRQGLGTCLFRRVCQATKATGAKGLLITANDNVALWWMSLSKDVGNSLSFHPVVIRNGKSSDGLRKATEKGHDRRLKKCPKYQIQSTPDGVSSKFYTDTNSGKPFRYGPSLTAHVWYIPSSGYSSFSIPKKKGASGSSSSSSSSSKYAAHEKGSKSSPTRTTNKTKRRNFRTAGTVVVGAVKFGTGSTGSSSRSNSKSGR